MNSISKTFSFEAAHIVRDAVSERCKFNVHGHSYKVEISVSGKIKENGMVLDFKELGFMKNVIDLFDHSMVLWDKESPDILKFFSDNFKRVIIMNKNCTAENMSRYFYKRCSESLFDKQIEVEYVKVWETANSYAYTSEYDGRDTITSIH